MNSTTRSIRQDKDFFYLADAIDASPRPVKVIPLPPFPAGEEELPHPGWNPKWPSRSEWIKTQYLQYQSLTPSQRVKADYYRAQSEKLQKEMQMNEQRIKENENENEQWINDNEEYQCSLTAEELDDAIDKFQSLLPPHHYPGRNFVAPKPQEERDPERSNWIEECTTAYHNYLANYQPRLPLVPSTPVNHVPEMATPTMTRKSSTLESFLTFMTPRTFVNRQRREKKNGKPAFSIL